METKANYTAVGAFVLLLAGALFISVAWLAKVSFERAVQPYHIMFTGTVTGLVEGSPVRYRGVSVGTVTDIRINPANVEEVQVTVEVPADTPIKKDAVASLEPVGVTGGVYVEIAGGSQGAELLAKDADGIPTIPSRPSAIAAVLEGAPVLLKNLTQISLQMTELLNDDNRKAVSTILGNLATASGEVSSTARNANQLLADLRNQTKVLGAQANTLLERANSTLETVGGDVSQVSGDLAQTTIALRDLVASLDQTSKALTAILEENREPIRDFTGTALYDFGQLLVHMQDLVNNLGRVTTRLERNPSEILFGTTESGVKVK